VTWRVQLETPARKDLRRLHPLEQRRVVAALEGLAKDPAHHPQSANLEGELRGIRRLRAGELRVAYTIEPDSHLVVVWAIGPRESIYQLLKQRGV
jgi:mRNA interferase RelE/StbE